MRRTISAALALVLTMGLVPTAAHAQDNNLTTSWNTLWNWLTHGQDPRLAVAGISVGIGTDVAGYYLTKKRGSWPSKAPTTALGAYGITTGACILVYPFVATVLVNRPLTPREAYTGIADCIVPFVGGWLADQVIPHDAWTDGLPVKPAPHKRG
jgi:hypothetical protein